MQVIIIADKKSGIGDEQQKLLPSCMVPVNGIPIINRMLRQLSLLKFDRIVVVTGYDQKIVENYIEEIKERQRVEFVYNPHFGNNSIVSSLFEAKEKLLQDDTILIDGNLVLDEQIVGSLKESVQQNCVVLDRYERWMDGMKIQIDEEGTIVNFVPKVIHNKTTRGSYCKALNIFKFSKLYLSKKIVPFLEAFVLSKAVHGQFEDILQILSLIGDNELKALLTDGKKWYSIKDKQDLDIAEALFADEKDIIRKFYGRFGGYWRFPQMLNYCYLENPFFKDLTIKNEIEDNIQTLLTNYPSGMAINTLLASKCWKVKEEYIVPGNGASELINVLLNTLEGTFGVIRPTFEEYPNRLKNKNVVTYIPQNDDYRYDTESLIAFFDKNHADNIVLINPDNPTGNYITKEKLLGFAKWCEEHHANLIVDESFIDYSEDSMDGTLLVDGVLENHRNLIVIKSISKSLGVTGIRLGIMSSANTDLIKEVKSKLSIWNINSLAEYLMQILNKHEDECQRMYQKVIEERKSLVNALRRISYLRVIPTQANFVLCEVLPPYKARELVILLLKRYNILIRDCTGKLGLDKGNYIRLTVRPKDDNQRLVKALNQIV